MSLAAPKLDDRTFQQLVDEAKKRIPHYTKEWTDHNVSDPGVTLIELFAWLTETTLYRLNRLPDRHYIKFMEMLGLKLKAPVPARVPVTFWLTAAANSEVVVPAGTEVASTQTETEPSIVFTTERPLTVLPPELSAVCTRVAAPDKKKRLVEGPVLRILQAGLKKPFPVFTQPQPEEEDALYLGFQNDLSHQVLRLDMEWEEAKGIGIEPSMPPLIWEASTGDNEQRWQPCDVEIDTTEGLNKNGRVQLHLPQMGMYPVDKQRMFWVRVRVRRISPAEKRDGMQPYAESPKLIRVNVSGWGGTIMATHSQTIRNETIGQSDGSAGQRFHVKRAPLLARTPDEHLMVFIEGEKPHEWAEVDDFANSGPNSCHYLLDSVSGELRFGPAIRQPDGTIKLYGAIPPRLATLVFTQYRYGGGDDGNVDVGVLNVRKTAIPYIHKVENRKAASGGQDAESLADAMVRAPQIMRHRERAVTAQDYEDLALQTPDVRFGRIKCLQPRPSDTSQVAPGQVYVLILPRVRQPEGYLTPEQLEPATEDIARLEAYLDRRRLLTTRLYINKPAYHWAAARVMLRADINAEQDKVTADVLARLHRFLNPFVGGQGGTGWPFGRELFLPDLYQCLQGIPNVQFVRSVELYDTEAGEGPTGKPVESIRVLEHGVIVSGKHEVVFI